MTRWVDALLEQMLLVPEALLYLILGLVAALENLVPPIPADMVILLGGFLVGQGAGRLWLAFLVVWWCNVAGALLVYGVGRRYGAGFFAGRLGRYLLQPRQLASLSMFYHRYGFGVLFLSRFLPVFRSLVPVFAGVSHVGLARTAFPVAMASGLWYGTILYLGAAAGENWQQIAAVLERGGRWLLLAAVGIALVLLALWRRSRSDELPR
jgi:membrane protein DedA with SNARE-associated domain